MKKIIFASIILSLFIYSAIYAGDNKFIPSGTWRGVFLIKENTEVPFNFEVKDNGQVYLINANERFETGKIKITVSLNQKPNLRVISAETMISCLSQPTETKRKRLVFLPSKEINSAQPFFV